MLPDYSTFLNSSYFIVVKKLAYRIPFTAATASHKKKVSVVLISATRDLTGDFSHLSLSLSLSQPNSTWSLERTTYHIHMMTLTQE